MNGLELSLQVLVALESISHIFVMHVFIRNLQRHKELSSVCLSLQVWKTAEEPVENMLECTFLSVNDIAAVVRVEVTRVAQYLQETADTLLSLLLRFFLHVNGLVGAVQVGENAIHEFKQLQWRLVVELDHAQVAHEGRAIQSIHDDLDLLCVEVGCLTVDFCTGDRPGTTVTLPFSYSKNTQLNSI